MDSMIISGIVDVLIAIIGFGGGIGVAMVTQKHTDARHDKDIDVQKDEDIDKKIDQFESNCKKEVDSIRKDTKESLENIEKQMSELKDLFSEMKATYQQSQAVTEIKIERLTDECRKHNGVIERTFKLESASALHEEQIKVANKRIADLERHEENDNK